MPNSASAQQRIVIATFGSLGDLHPFLALAVELRQRGHHVVFATARHYAARIAALGLEFAAIGPDVSPEDPALLHRLMRTARGPEYLIRKLFLPSLPRLYDELEALCADADLLVASEICFAAPVLAEKTGIPLVSCLLSPFSFLSPHDAPVLPPLNATRHLHGLPAAFHRTYLALPRLIMRRWEEPLQAFRAGLGLQRTSAALLQDKFRADLVLAMFSRHFAARQPDWPANTVQSGFAYYVQQANGPLSPERSVELATLEEFLQTGEPPVVFTLGSAAVHAAGRFFEESAATAVKLGRRAVLVGVSPQSSVPQAPGILPVGYADYRRLFPHAAAVVHQGGIGTTAEALRAGVPQLVVPFNFDQPDNAARIARLGVGRTISRDRYGKSRAVRELTGLLAKSSYRNRARQIADGIAQERGTASAVDAIEGLLRTSQTPAEAAP